MNQSAESIKKKSGTEVLPVVCDISTDKGRDTLFETCIKHFGNPDILVTNNGGPKPGDPKSFEEKDYQSALNNNFLSAVSSVKKVLPSMIEKNWGRIIMITSAAVKQPVQHLILSNTARSALTAYAKTLATDLAKTGITVNTVLPGVHSTARVESLVNSIAQQENRTVKDVLDEWSARVPVGRLGTIEEFGSLVTYLCSRQAGFITGQAILHDGGGTLGML